MKVHTLPIPLRLAGAALLAASGHLAAAADYPTTVLAQNPLAYYRLSEAAAAPAGDTAANSGSLGTLGTGFPGTDMTNRPAGIVGNCFKFINPGLGANADVQSVIDVGWNAALNPLLGHSFSIEFWANPTVANTDLVSPVNSLDFTHSRSGFLVYLDGPNHRWEFRMGGLSSYCGTIDSANGSAVSNVWQHVVAVYDGGNMLLYLNGALVAGPVAANGGAGYTPNGIQPFRIGGNTAGTASAEQRGYDGLLDEVAFYGTNLSASAIAAHYAAATTNNAGYHAQILLDNPVEYLHLDEAPYTAPAPGTFPITANLGSLGAAANGANNPGLATGIAGPSFSGFGANNLGIQNGYGGGNNGYGGGNVDLGNPAGLDIVGPITMIAWVNPGPANVNLHDIVAHGFGASSEVFMRINNGVYEVGSWDGTTSYSVSGAMNSGGLGSDVGNWVFLAATYDGANWNLYRYDNLVTNAPFGNGALSVPDAPWSIGSAGPNTDARWLGGGIDEVAIFDTALTTAQIQQIFYSANVTPIIVTPLASQVNPPVFAGDSLNLIVAAEGNKPITYLWTKNGASLGNTSTSFSIPSLTTGDSGTYAVIATNPSGSTTNSVVLNVLLVPPTITQQPSPETLYVGGSAAFSVSVTGSTPFTYQWKSNNVAISGANTPSYALNNVQLSYAANYTCSISGPGGSTNTANAALTVLATPAYAYPQAVLADSPAGYWRLDETSGTVAHDTWKGHDGTFNNVTLGLPPFSATTDGGTAAGFGAQDHYVGGINGIDFSGLDNPFSLEVWVNGPSGQPDGTGIIAKGRGLNGAGGTYGYQFILQTLGGNFDFHVEPSGTAGAVDVQATGLGPDSTWHHVACTYDSGGAMTIYVDGSAAGAGTGPVTGPGPTTLPVSIGAAQGGVTPVHDLFFTGTLDEVAIYNYALSAAQVLAHAQAGYGPHAPLITAEPAPATNYIGYSNTFSVTASGSVPITYQWYKGNSPLSDGGNIAGASTRLLTVSPLDLPDAGNYHCLITNSVASTNTTIVSLTVLPTPTSSVAIAGLVVHLPFNNNLTDVTGRGNNGTGHGGPTFVPDGPLNAAALHYATTTSGGSGTPVTSASYVTLGVVPDLQFGSNASFSVSMWVREQAYNGVGDEGDLPFFTDTVNSTFGFGYVFAPSYQLGSWAYSLYDINGHGAGAYGANYLIDDGNWHHLVFVMDRQHGATTYLDGQAAAYTLENGSTSITTANATVDTGHPATIGQDPTGLYTEPGSGDIADLGVFRTALSPLQVAGIYLGGFYNHVSFAGAPITLNMQPTPGNLMLSWPAGTLQSADSVTGPYTDVTPISPYTAPTTGAKKFYRVRL